jgi:hypothetical protein
LIGFASCSPHARGKRTPSTRDAPCEPGSSETKPDFVSQERDRFTREPDTLATKQSQLLDRLAPRRQALDPRLDAANDFNFVIAKISVTTEITEFREIRPKFRRIFLEIKT